jgi:hypothetical protein
MARLDAHRAALLAAARVASNNGRRILASDRAADNGNIDLMGAASELLLYQCLERFKGEIEEGQIQFGSIDESSGLCASGLSYMQANLFVPGGGSKAAGSDLVFAENGEAIDAKSFNCSPKNKYFAINADKHESLRKERPHYFCLIVRPFGRSGYYGTVAYDVVDSWTVKELRAGKPWARVFPIDPFCLQILGQDYSALKRRVQPVFCPPDAMDVVGSSTDWTDLTRIVPPLRQAVDRPDKLERDVREVIESAIATLGVR